MNPVALPAAACPAAVARELRTTTGSVSAQQLSAMLGEPAARYVLLRHRPKARVGLARWTCRTALNPYFLVQHAHARLCRMLSAAAELGVTPDQSEPTDPVELELLSLLAYPPATSDPVPLIGRLERLAAAVHAFADLPGTLPTGDQRPTSSMRGRIRLAAAAREAIGTTLTALHLPALERI